MTFLEWHYTTGLKLLLQQYWYSLAKVNHYFSLPLLLLSLFSPWKRLTDSSSQPGFQLSRWLEQASFNFISRFIGAIVRLSVFVAGFSILVGDFVLWLFLTAIWLIIPFVGLPFYSRYLSFGPRILRHLVSRLNTSPSNFIPIFVSSDIGSFFQVRTGLTSDQLASCFAASQPPQLETVTSCQALVDQFLSQGLLSEKAIRSLKLAPEDFSTAAVWWDLLHLPENSDGKLHLSRPGIGLELLFGYTPQLNRYSTDLSVPQSFSRHLIGREELVSKMENVLLTGQNVALVGDPGVGKKTVVLEFARRAYSGELSPKMSYQRILELDYNSVLSQSWDLNSKKNVLHDLLKEAAAAGNVILVIKDIHRITNPWVEGYDLTDVFETALEKRNLKIIAISSRVDYERFVYSNFRLRKFFQTVEVTQPTVETAAKILMGSANAHERKYKNLRISVQAIRAIIEGSERFITEIPFPEKALELLDLLVVYAQSKKITSISQDDVNRVLTEKTGIGLISLTNSEKKLLSNLEEVLHTELIGQNTAITLIAKSLRSRSMGIKDEKRPIGSFLFLGPTGVGKTQTAKTLAKLYFGEAKRLIRFDMAEYIGSDGLDKLLGSVSRNQPGLLTTAIKNNPASLLLLDEIEKASPDIFNLFLSMLDEGFITDSFGRKVICSHLFIIATSNAGAEFIRQQMSHTTTPEDLQRQVIDHIQKERIFPPEFINRFDGVVVYEPLKPEDLNAISRLMLQDVTTNLKKQNVFLEVDESVYQKLATDGFLPEFGARPMRRIVDIVIGDIISKSLLSDQIKSGDKLLLSATGSGLEDYDLQSVAQ